jgi:hypothetical protein
MTQRNATDTLKYSSRPVIILLSLAKTSKTKTDLKFDSTVADCQTHGTRLACRNIHEVNGAHLGISEKTAESRAHHNKGINNIHISAHFGDLSELIFYIGRAY